MKTEAENDYTSEKLLEKLKPNSKKVYLAQSLVDGLMVNTADMFTILIKEAARCNDYSSDVFYDLQRIATSFKEFVNVFTPVWIGFRRHGVDGTEFVLSRIKEYKDVYDCIYKEYFALYSVHVEQDAACNDFYNVVFSKYNT